VVIYQGLHTQIIAVTPYSLSQVTDFVY